MDQHPLRGFLEGSDANSSLRKPTCALRRSEKIIQPIIDPMRIRFVFTAIQHDDTRIAPVESAVGFIAHIVEKTAQADRIGIAYLMVATDIEDEAPGRLRPFRSVH